MQEDIEQAYRSDKFKRLAAAIALDVVGMLTLVFPVVGELGDLVWAPVAAIASVLLFGGRAGVVGGALTFVEEALPFTDIVPSLTLTWAYKYVAHDNESFEAFAQHRLKRKSIRDSYKAAATP
jgi:hypothetical protein